VDPRLLNQATLKDDIDRSVVIVTALSPVIGYDQAAAISYHAIDHDFTVKQAALANGGARARSTGLSSPRGGTADIPSGKPAGA
jgi:fumarate hydratase, class II